MYIFNIMGVSGVGKDTLARFISDLLPEKPYMPKWSHPMKKAIEEWYGLAPGSLEDRVFRTQQVRDNTDKSYLDILISAHNWVKETDPEMMTQVVAREVIRTNPRYIIFTDTRTGQELLTLYRLGGTVVDILVTRQTATPLESDQWVKDYFKNIYSSVDYVVKNDYSISYLRDKAEEIISDLIP